MADENETSTFKLDLDVAEFILNANQAKMSIQNLGGAEGISELVSGLGEATIAVGALAGAFFLGKAAFEAVLDAEHIRMVTAQFDDLTSQVGLFGTKLREQLVDASKGWVDETTLMGSANKALLELETGFDKLPEIMEIARQRTAVFGGTVIGTFDSINQAVSTGTTRQLRHLGIIIDQQKAYREYAQSIGATVDSLSLAGKQQAVLNALLEDQRKKQFNAHEDLIQTTSDWEKLKTTIKEFKDIAVEIIDNMFGPLVNAAVRAGTAVTNFFKNALVDVGHISGYLKIKDADKDSQTLADNEKNRIQELSNARAAADKVDPAIAAKKEADAKKELANIDRELSNEQLKNVDTLDAATSAYQAHLAQMGAQIDQQMQSAFAAYQRGEITYEQYLERTIELDKLKTEKLKANEAELEREQFRSLDNYQRKATGVADAVGRAFQVQSQKSALDLQRGMKFGESAVSSFSSRSVSSIEAWGAGTKSATDAIEGMFAGMAGDMASNYGQMMMLASIWPPNPVAFAGGVALVALGGYLKSLASSSSSTSAPAAGGGGGAGVSSFGATSAEIPAPSQAMTESQQEKKSVNLVIQGHMFMNDQTQRWLVDQIRSAADATDFKIQSVGGGL
jgi:hypothetical protein